MSFDIKYDKNGQVIPNAATEQRLEAENVAALASQAQETPVAEPVEAVQPEAVEQPTEAITESSIPDEEYQVAAEQAQERKHKAAAESFRELREKTKQLERERDEYMRKLQEAQTQKEEVDDTDLSIGDADLAEGKHLKKLQSEIKRLRKEADTNRQQSHVTQAEVRLKSQYPDFDKVVSADNINSLREEFPELAATINSNNDIYQKAVSAYTMIKKLGIHQEPTYNPEKARIAQNVSKPKPSATIAPQKSDSPLSQANAFANGLTPELQKQLWSEMSSLRKNY